MKKQWNKEKEKTKTQTKTNPSQRQHIGNILLETSKLYCTEPPQFWGVYKPSKSSCPAGSCAAWRTCTQITTVRTRLQHFVSMIMCLALSYIAQILTPCSLLFHCTVWPQMPTTVLHSTEPKQRRSQRGEARC